MGTTLAVANLMRADGTIAGGWLRTANPAVLIASLAILDVQIAYTNIKTAEDLQGLVNNADYLLNSLESAQANYQTMQTAYKDEGCK